MDTDEARQSKSNLRNLSEGVFPPTDYVKATNI